MKGKGKGREKKDVRREEGERCLEGRVKGGEKNGRRKGKGWRWGKLPLYSVDLFQLLLKKVTVGIVVSKEKSFSKQTKTKSVRPMC